MSAHPLKYAHVESERRFLLRTVPSGVTRSAQIVDRYVDGTRLRLRQVTAAGGDVVLKLGHKVRLTGSAERVACTSLYLDEAEFDLLCTLPTTTVTKVRRWIGETGLVVDEYDDGTLIAEIDGGDEMPTRLPAGLDIVREVTDDEAFTGLGRAQWAARHPQA